jgi:hypothetical protein
LDFIQVKMIRSLGRRLRARRRAAEKSSNLDNSCSHRAGTRIFS